MSAPGETPGEVDAGANGTGPPTTVRAGRERRLEIITVYAIGLFQGLSLVAFPAAASILQSSTGYDLSKSRYGLLFLPQVIMAIAGSLTMPRLARRFRLKRVLIAGLIADTVAMGLLVAAIRSALMRSPTRCCWWPPGPSASASDSH